MKRLRVAVIGAGRLGGFHAHKLVGFPHVELVAVVDPAAASRNRLAAECNTTPLAEHRPLVGKIDAAVIATPTVLHHAIARELLEAKTHLLVEKPLCATLAEADELVEAARRNQVVLQVGHIERFNPALAAAVPHVREPKYIEAVRAAGFTFRSMDVGVVLDLMIHDIDLVLALVRAPLVRVEALGISVLGGYEDVANARLQFEGGCLATLSASRVALEPVRRMHVWGARAYAHLDFATRTTTLVRPSEALLRRQFHPERLTPEQVEYYRERLAEEHLPREQRRFEAVDALALELQDFVEAILTPRQPRVTGEAGRDALAVAEQILAAMAAHGWDAAAAPGVPAVGPLSRVVPAPHFDLSAAQHTQLDRRAG
ncbi:MAG: Gfo/Idh/MocA family oxidoreductase [Thermoguttaceae bacterium]|jgi:predicted dehydrogenase